MVCIYIYIYIYLCTYLTVNKLETNGDAFLHVCIILFFSRISKASCIIFVVWIDGEVYLQFVHVLSAFSFNGR